jgi:hypothetical protein
MNSIPFKVNGPESQVGRSSKSSGVRVRQIRRLRSLDDGLDMPSCSTALEGYRRLPNKSERGDDAGLTSLRDMLRSDGRSPVSGDRSPA